jgi:hypothetical protein
MTCLPSPAYFCISAALCATASSAFANPPADAIIDTPAPQNEWEFQAKPYGWLTALNGTADVGGLAAAIDFPFSNIFQHLDMAAALQLEARRGRWGILADGFYADLSASGSPPGPLYHSIEAELKQFIGELSLSYRLYECDRAFVDMYAGVRYNAMSLDLSADPNETIINNTSTGTTGRIAEAIEERGEEIVSARVAEFQAAAPAQRAVIAGEIRAKIEQEADGTIRRNLARELAKLRREIPDRVVRLNVEKAIIAVEKQRISLARNTAQLKLAELRASVDASLEGKVDIARERLDKAKRNLKNAINRELNERLPANASVDKNWADPIVGVRTQWPLGDHFFLAAQGDVGGFGVSSDMAWRAQATVGCQFNESVSAELGYRYLHTDYSDGAFTYDMTQSGIFTGLNFRF